MQLRTAQFDNQLSARRACVTDLLRTIFVPYSRYLLYGRLVAAANRDFSVMNESVARDSCEPHSDTYNLDTKEMIRYITTHITFRFGGGSCNHMCGIERKDVHSAGLIVTREPACH